MAGRIDPCKSFLAILFTQSITVRSSKLALGSSEATKYITGIVAEFGVCMYEIRLR